MKAKPLPPEVLADSLQDRIGPSSGKLICATAIGINQPPPGVGPALSALIERWRAVRDRLNMKKQGADHRLHDLLESNEVADELEAALSGSVGGLNAAPPAVWREIATMPDDADFMIGAWYFSGNMMETGELSREGANWFDINGTKQEPKFWMPLPASPVCAAEKKQEKG